MPVLRRSTRKKKQTSECTCCISLAFTILLASSLNVIEVITTQLMGQMVEQKPNTTQLGTINSDLLTRVSMITAMMGNSLAFTILLASSLNMIEVITTQLMGQMVEQKPNPTQVGTINSDLMTRVSMIT